MKKQSLTVLVILILLAASSVSAHSIFAPVTIDLKEISALSITNSLVYFETQPTSSVKICYFTAHPASNFTKPFIFSFNAEPIKDKTCNNIAWGSALPTSSTLQTQLNSISYLPFLLNTSSPALTALAPSGRAFFAFSSKLSPGWTESLDKPPRT